MGRSKLLSATSVQLKPASSLQAEEQPSPLRVLPSSHCSPPNLMPSPHSEVQGAGGTQVGSKRQSMPQPSPELLSSSSQLSPGSSAPSPHSSGSATTRQPESQITPATLVVPSLSGPLSQSSKPAMVPSPQLPAMQDVLGGHTQPASIVQSARQPSSFRWVGVSPRSPSSHSSVPWTAPSPQIMGLQSPPSSLLPETVGAGQMK